VKLTNHLYLVPRLGTYRAIPPLTQYVMIRSLIKQDIHLHGVELRYAQRQLYLTYIKDKSCSTLYHPHYHKFSITFSVQANHKFYQHAQNLIMTQYSAAVMRINVFKHEKENAGFLNSTKVTNTYLFTCLSLYVSLPSLYIYLCPSITYLPTYLPTD